MDPLHPLFHVFEAPGRAARRRSAAADLELDFAGTRLRFQVMRSFLGAADLLAEPSAQRPNLYPRGPGSLLPRLEATAPGDHVEITGYRRPRSRALPVSDVAITPRDAG